MVAVDARRNAARAESASGLSAWAWLRRALLSPPLLVALLAWALMLPSAARVVQLSPDMAEYVDVARRVVNGEGYVLGIKAYHIGGPEVIHDGLMHRPPLFTLVLAMVMAGGLDLYAAQVLNAAFGAVSAAMVCSIGTRLAGRAVGVAAGLLAAASPIGLEQQVQLLGDALGTMLTLAAVRSLMLAADRSSVRPALLAGLLFGIAYLARPPALVIAGALVLSLPLLAPRLVDARPLVLGLLGGLAVVVAPVTLFSMLTRGRLSYSGKGYLFGVVSDADIMENGYAMLPLRPVEFITSNPAFVAGAVWSVTTLYVRSIFLEREWLAPLVVGWPGAVLALARGWYPWTAKLVLVAAGANVAFYCVSWSIWQDRYMLVTVFLLLPFVVDGLLRALRPLWNVTIARWTSPQLAARGPALLLGLAIAAVLLAWSPRFLEQYQGEFRYGERPAGTRITGALRWTGPPRWVNDGSLDEGIEWIRAQTTNDTVLAHGHPWPYGFFTGRPIVLLPYRLSDDLLRQFLVEYRVSYVLYDPRDPQRREYADQLRDLSGDGVRMQRVRNLMVFDTRPLWQTQSVVPPPK